MKRWTMQPLLVSVVAASIAAASSQSRDVLTAQEREWLDAHEGAITYVPCPNYAPIEFIDESGVHRGVAADFIRLIEENLGFRLKRIYVSTWKELIDKAKSKQADVVGSIQKTPERSAYLNFTEPFITIPNAIIVKKGRAQKLTLEEMGGMRVGVVHGYATVEYIEKNNPAVIVERVKDDPSGLEKVSLGELDAIITDLAVASHYISQLGISNLHTAGTIDYRWKLRFGSRKDLPILADILQKGIDAIDENQRQEISHKWISVSVRKEYNKWVVWTIAATVGSLLLIVLVVVVWNRSLKRRVDERTTQLRKELEERQRAEKALQKSEKQFRTLISNIPGAVYRRENTAFRRWLFISDEVEALTGYSSREFLYSGIATTNDIIFGEDKETVQQLVAQAIENKEPFGLEYRIVHKDGTIRWIFEKGQGVFDGEGTLSWVDGTLFDITERVIAREEKEFLKKRLDQAEKMETIGALAGGVAHDLNNILGAVVGYPEILLRSMTESSSLYKPLLAIQQSGEQAALVVQDLLTLARRGIVVRDVIDLNDIVEKYLNSEQHSSLLERYPHIEVSSSLEPNLLSILGSSVHLTKTLMNLVTNAAEAIDDDGRITISTNNIYLDRPLPGYDVVESGDYVLLEVADTGVGIAESDINRIFEPFYTTKKMGRSGTGLGMSVVWGTVKDHRGYIDVDSTEGKGTAFKLYFPVTREQTKLSQDQATSLEQLKGNGEKILVVDDVESQRELASIILSQLNYDVVTVASGEEAIAYVEKTPVDLVLLDMIMDPGIDGLETYEGIVEFCPGQKAIITSGYSRTERVEKAQKLGAGQYVKKPYTIEKLGLAVQEELSDRRE